MLVVQTAAAFALLAAGALFWKSLSNFRSIEVGFDLNATYHNIDLARLGYKNADLRLWLDRLERELNRAYGHEWALSTSFPLEGALNLMQIKPDDSPESEWTTVAYSEVSLDYFRVLDIPVLLGREFSPSETLKATAAGEMPIILPAATARHLWPEGTAIGRRIASKEREFQYTVVGVVSDHKQTSLTRPQATAFVPLGETYLPLQFTVILTPRATGWRPFPEVVRDVDPSVAVGSSGPLSDRVDQLSTGLRLQTGMFLGLALFALILNSAALYALLSWMVESRSYEIGVRQALGAGPSKVAVLVLSHGVKILVIGMLLGAAVGWALQDMIRSRLFEVTAFDSLSWMFALIAILVSGAMGMLRPLVRLLRIDPARVLRAE